MGFKDYSWVFLVFSSYVLAVCFAKDAVLSRQPSRPNIVFILTDDQDVDLGGLTPNAKVQKLLKQEGTEFTNMYATTPLCCPSRSSILTGRYQHNHNALNNSVSGNCSSTLWQQTLEKETLASYAHSLKYHTFFAGKYLNQYGGKSVGGPEHVPPGWDEWIGLVGNSVYYNYTISDNGEAVSHGDDYHKDYFTDLIANRSVKYIKERAKDIHKMPFLMMISTPAPHQPWNAAPQYSDSFKNLTAPRTPNYNKRGTDKHWLIRQTFVPMKKFSTNFSDVAFRSRWQTLLSVDDLVERVVMTLNSTGMLDNTYIIYTSDNGYHLGQFGLPYDKRQLYECDIRVPLIVRGPGVTKNVTRAEPVLNIDLTPTMLDIINGSLGNFPKEMDGNSFIPLLHLKPNETVKWRKDFLIEYQGEGKVTPKDCPNLGFGVSECFPDCVCEDSFNNTYSCVRTLVPGDVTQNIMYCEFTDDETFVEVYNITTDPYEMTNIKKSVDPKLLVRMNTRLIELGFCGGSACRSNGRHGGYTDVENSESSKEHIGKQKKKKYLKSLASPRKKSDFKFVVDLLK